MNKPAPRNAQADAPDASAPLPKRRQLVIGASVAVGAAVAAAATLRQPGQAPATVAQATPGATSEEGYRLTDHIRRYYETTRT